MPRMASPESAPPPQPPLELLAPAGDRACLEAALEAGADAVYLGLTALNARRHARNFSESELARACEQVHDRCRRLYLTLNIDLAQDELARAARLLELASELRVDAVLVRDPALLALGPHFPELAYHLSTQACLTSRADVEAARALGIRRVVLARELTLAEIAAASAVQGIETEVFALGALCFCISGRCLLSSWVGGRSGNRGQCTSPCRVPWTLDGRPGGTPFSLHDLSLAGHVDALRGAGVRALKIEGRMKNPSWVRAAVARLRAAIDHPGPAAAAGPGEERRGATPGRRLTAGYLEGRRDDLIVPTGPAGPDDGSAPPPPSRTAERSLRPAAAALLRTFDAPSRPEPGVTPDRVRLAADQAPAFLEAIRPVGGALVEGLDAPTLRHLAARPEGENLIVALPAVFFEDEREALVALVATAAALGLPVEVNSHGGWRLAREAGVRLLGGPGLGVLNALAAHELSGRGFTEVTASIEADALQLEALMVRVRVPCSVVVFGRPPLMVTRVDLRPEVTRAELEDRRAARLRARRAGPLWELRPVQPLDLRGRRLPPAIAHAVVDLIGSPDPAAEWQCGPEGASAFNLDRTLA
jgi:collagenase-like PrtC family protease